MLINPKAKLLAALDHAEEYRVLAIRSRDRGERESYERIVLGELDHVHGWRVSAFLAGPAFSAPSGGPRNNGASARGGVDHVAVRSPGHQAVLQLALDAERVSQP